MKIVMLWIKKFIDRTLIYFKNKPERCRNNSYIVQTYSFNFNIFHSTPVKDLLKREIL